MRRSIGHAGIPRMLLWWYEGVLMICENAPRPLPTERLQEPMSYDVLQENMVLR